MNKKLFGNWKKAYYPKSGWSYLGCFYSYKPVTCQMCLCRNIKYVHRIFHLGMNKNINVGIDCCEQLLSGEHSIIKVAKENESIIRSKYSNNNNHNPNQCELF